MKMLILLLSYGLIFGLGFYVGQRPTEVKQQLRTISGEVLEKTIGLNKGLTLKREIVEAKEQLLDGQLSSLDHDYSTAVQNIEQSIEHLKKAKEVEQEGELSKQIGRVIERLRQTHTRLAQGEGISRRVFKDVTRQVDALLP